MLLLEQSVFGAVCSGSTLFTSILVSNARQLFAADDFSRRHFQMHFFLGALRVKEKMHLQENTLFDLNLGIKDKRNVPQYP